MKNFKLKTDKSIIVTGSLAFDQIMTFPGKFADHILPDKIHVISLSFLVDSMERNFGGTAGNIAYTLSLFGETPIIVAAAGNDFSSYGSHLRKHGVNTRSILQVRIVQTANFFVVTDQMDNQIGGFFPGAMSHADKTTIASASKKAELVIIAPDKPEAMVKHANECRDYAIPYIFEPAQQIPRLSKNDLTDCLLGAIAIVGNDYEISLLTKKCSISSKELVEKVNLLVTTKGPNGSILETKNQTVTIPAVKPTNAVDPTGAGDAYLAGLAWGLKKGFPLKKIGRLASLSATYAVEIKGTQNHAFDLTSFSRKFQKHYKEQL